MAYFFHENKKFVIEEYIAFALGILGIIFILITLRLKKIYAFQLLKPQLIKKKIKIFFLFSLIKAKK